jgi:hypothetical protein
MLYHVEIEFRDADGNVETRIFNRADTVVFEHDHVAVREAANTFFLGDRSRIVRFECETFASRVDQDGMDELTATVADLCADRRRIQAIKVVRETLGYGLKDSKRWVDDRFPPPPPTPAVDYDSIPF